MIEGEYGGESVVVIELDPDVVAAYVRLRPGVVARTLEVDARTYVDVDRDGWALGVEVLGIVPAPAEDETEANPWW